MNSPSWCFSLGLKNEREFSSEGAMTQICLDSLFNINIFVFHPCCQIFPNAPKAAGISGPPQPRAWKFWFPFDFSKGICGEWEAAQAQGVQRKLLEFHFEGLVLNVGPGWNISRLVLISQILLFLLNLFSIWFLCSFCSLEIVLSARCPFQREDYSLRIIIFLGFS